VIRIYLTLLVIVGLWWILRQFQRLPAETVAVYIRKYVLMALLFVLLLLMLSGRLNGLFALMGLAIAGLMRLLPLVFRYAPQLQKLWLLFQSGKAQANQQTHNKPTQNGMTVMEAYEILGLKAGASRQEIITAHKKLMQKNHPDRGGSDYLATKINLAKTVLLNQ